MRRKLYAALTAVVLVASFGSMASVASADGDSIMCTLEKKGLYHSPLYSACGEQPPY